MINYKVGCGLRIKALLGMVRSRHPDVLSQVARGVANFAKCESITSTKGNKNGRSLLIEDGALPWIVQNANNDASIISRHIELALCHLAQHEVNAKDLVFAYRRGWYEVLQLAPLTCLTGPRATHESPLVQN